MDIDDNISSAKLREDPPKIDVYRSHCGRCNSTSLSNSMHMIPSHCWSCSACVVGNEIQATYDRVWWFRFSEIEASEEDENFDNVNTPFDPDMAHCATPLKGATSNDAPYPGCYSDRSIGGCNYGPYPGYYRQCPGGLCRHHYDDLHHQIDAEYKAKSFKRGLTSPFLWNAESRVQKKEEQKQKTPVIKLVTKK